MSLAHHALTHGTLPALVFDAALETDEPGTVDLRALDVPTSDVELRNELRARWRETPRLVVRVDEDPTARIEALLFELVRREVRLTGTEVDRFSDAHTVVVKVASKAPPPRLARLFSVRVRASASASSVAAKAPLKSAPKNAPKTAPKLAPKTAPQGRTDARRR